MNAPRRAPVAASFGPGWWGMGCGSPFAAGGPGAGAPRGGGVGVPHPLEPQDALDAGVVQGEEPLRRLARAEGGQRAGDRLEGGHAVGPRRPPEAQPGRRARERQAREPLQRGEALHHPASLRPGPVRNDHDRRRRGRRHPVLRARGGEERHRARRAEQRLVERDAGERVLQDLRPLEGEGRPARRVGHPLALARVADDDEPERRREPRDGGAEAELGRKAAARTARTALERAWHGLPDLPRRGTARRAGRTRAGSGAERPPPLHAPPMGAIVRLFSDFV